MPLLENLNYGAYQYYTTTLFRVREICHPLFSLGVKYFGYIKIFENGSYLLVSTDEESTKQYLSTIKSQGATPTLKVESAPIGKSHHVKLSSDISVFDKEKDALLHFFYDRDLWPLYAIYKNREDYIEAYCFAMSRADEYTPHFYIQTAPLLEHFCLYFAERAEDLICIDDTKKLAYFQQQFSFNQMCFEDQWAQKAKEFLLKTRLRHVLINGKNHQVVSLPKRQGECLQHHALGKSAKEIAGSLSLSPRTIEDYLQKIKSKTGYTCRSQIVSNYLKNRPLDLLLCK